jgi:hypothetical protein
MYLKIILECIVLKMERPVEIENNTFLKYSTTYEDTLLMDDTFIKFDDNIYSIRKKMY